MIVKLLPETEFAVREAIDPILPSQATKGRPAAIARIRGNRKDNRLPDGANLRDLLREGRA